MNAKQLFACLPSPVSGQSPAISHLALDHGQLSIGRGPIQSSVLPPFHRRIDPRKNENSKNN